MTEDKEKLGSKLLEDSKDCKSKSNRTSIAMKGSDFLSQTQIQLTWQEVSYTVQSKKQTLEILKKVSGSAVPGEFLAIMGSSGSGKTSLLNILSGRTGTSKKEVVTGKVLVNNIPFQEIPYGDYSAYVTQQDILLPVLTPRESITFSAKLRCKDKSVKDRVDEIIQELKLTEIADNTIGSIEQKGISGGERKRVCIAVELVSDPALMFLDEPTSGLDAYTAEVLVKLLLKQTRKGRTVITTIHQPSSFIFSKFQKLILMSEGRIVYQGEAQKSVEYFASLGFVCPERSNPADFFISILRRNQEALSLETIIEAYSPSVEESPLNLDDLKLGSSKSKGILVQGQELLSRATKNAVRNPDLSTVKMLQSVGIALLIDLIFNNLGTNAEGVQSRSGLIFFITISQVTFGAQNSTLACKF